MDPIEHAARQLVVKMIQQNGGAFDFSRQGHLIISGMEMAARRVVGGENPWTARDNAIERVALEDARDAITFDALNPYRALDAHTVGRCVHRAKTIISRMIEELG